MNPELHFIHRIGVRSLLLVALTLTPWPGLSQSEAADGERALRHEIVIQASLDDVWRAWTTEKGLAPISSASHIELAVGGAYEWFLDLEPDAQGRRGSAGSRVLAFVPHEMLAFAWTFPPSMPGLREAGETTVVVVRLAELDPGHVRVRLDVVGWREGAEWDAGFAYFDSAWASVLAAMRESLESAEDAGRDVGGVRHWQDGLVSVTSVAARGKRQEFGIVLPASPAEVWNLLATVDGLRRQGATDPLVELRPGGAYRLWPGNDHNQVMAWIPEQLFVVSGSAPPQFPRVREGGTWSALHLTPVDGGERTHLRVVSVGWPASDAEYDAAFEYFLVNNPRWLQHLHGILSSEAGGDG